MGETRSDRIGFLHALATMPHPESVPINALVPVEGTVLGDMLKDTPLAKIDEVEFVRTVAVARIVMPQSMVRLSAGRESMSEACQALRSEEHTSELQSLMRISYAVFCLKKQTIKT